MISNVKIKVFLQQYVFGVFSILNKWITHDKHKILLYSNMGFRDNLKALYDYLMENEYCSKYEIVCSLNDYKQYVSSCPNVRFVSNMRGGLEFFSAGYVYYCFGKIPIVPGKNQIAVQMWHGSPYKGADIGMLRGHSAKHPYYSFAFSTSKHFVPIWCYNFSMPPERIIICGHPRCDALFKPNPHYDLGNYKKLILWAPTFRKSNVVGYNDTASGQQLLPVVKDDDWMALDNQLKQLGVKLLVKLHPIQLVNKMALANMGNLLILTHSDFCSQGMELYPLMVQSDALITDYSSIFYDYLLLDRPMAFTEDDVAEYGANRGFLVDDPDAYKPGFRIGNVDDLLTFIKNVRDGFDTFHEDRLRVLDLSNDYRDGNFCKRALECVGINNCQ